MEKQLKSYDVVVVGGGLAGLAAAAFLSFNGKKVALLERGKLGGRAVTLPIKGFNFNFGAHAIYGRDTSILKKFENELKLNIHWKDFNPYKARYDSGEELSHVPSNVRGLFKTKILSSPGKVVFAWEVFKTMLSIDSGVPHQSIGKWLEKQNIGEDVKKMMLTLASSNFFTSEPEQIPSEVFFQYYKRIFTTNKPVAYIGGGWQSLINEFVRVIKENDGEIFEKAKVTHAVTNENKVIQIVSGDDIYEAEEFIFAIPPKELLKVFKETDIEDWLSHYAKYKPSSVFVYDIGLSKRVESPFTYIYDRKNQMFITDISYYDETCTPEGGQLLQAVAYLKDEDIGNTEALDKYKQQIEALYDKHFEGWRENLVVPRVSKNAVVQEVKWNMNQQAMPIYFPDYRNTFFTGDWCQGQGQLSELSFSSAYDVCKLIMNK
ncbi:FAD-dependent oxidoreductase [Alkalihalobacterium elongatum]|uniref:FAD-dependent oxidoreductase n=1 Tax=Alkalihalobacterium elongatum TaxID=2675466 RepID=UPI001C200A36|nr:FAD-dependent oxidoreductase [Alkalihalobacterium elongatum]